MANPTAMAVTEGAARDNAEEWVLPQAARAQTFAQLESRVDVALTLAQASEAAVHEVGAAAIEAAEQARQAAELAERAAIAAQEAAAAAPPPPPAPVGPAGPAEPVDSVEPLGTTAATASQEEWLIHFTHRAERLSARLDRLRHC